MVYIYNTRIFGLYMSININFIINIFVKKKKNKIKNMLIKYKFVKYSLYPSIILNKSHM